MKLIKTDIICYNHAHMLWLLQQGYAISSNRRTNQHGIPEQFAYHQTWYYNYGNNNELLKDGYYYSADYYKPIPDNYYLKGIVVYEVSKL